MPVLTNASPPGLTHHDMAQTVAQNLKAESPKQISVACARTARPSGPSSSCGTAEKGTRTFSQLLPLFEANLSPSTRRSTPLQEVRIFRGSRVTSSQSREFDPHAPHDRKPLCSSSNSRSSRPAASLIRSSASRSLRQPAAPAATATIARPTPDTPFHRPSGTHRGRHTGSPGHGDPGLDHDMDYVPLGPSILTDIDTRWPTTLTPRVGPSTTFTPYQSPVTSVSSGRDRSTTWTASSKAEASSLSRARSCPSWRG